jgi:hypothetical protein
MSKNQKIVVENNIQKPIIICIEPWATEYGMMPNDTFEIVPEDEESDVYFHLTFASERITVYVEGREVSYPQIYQDGKLLDYGHNSF